MNDLKLCKRENVENLFKQECIPVGCVEHLFKKWFIVKEDNAIYNGTNIHADFIKNYVDNLNGKEFASC